MPIAKLSGSSSPDAMKSEEGNDSLDTFIRQAIGKEPFFSFPRSGDSPVQWIQLLHALDQQELPGWPLLTPLKVQMQKCEKCSKEFCSTINYRRHIRVHRRSLNVDKESHKNRDLLGAYWDKLPLDEAKEVVSFKDVTLEEVSGSTIIKTLSSTVRKPGFCTLPQVYLRAGSALLDIIQGRPSRIPISSQELFGILDDASERTFLCAGAAESVQKYIFDGEAGKIGLEIKNIIACTSFLVEQQLVKAWVADKDAEALRCQKLLVEEEEAAQKRQAVLLERKRQRKLRQKEQKVRDQSTGEKSEETATAETSVNSPPSEDDSHTDVFSHHEQSQSSKTEHDNETHAEHYPDVETQRDHGSNRRHVVITRWQAPKRNGFHQNMCMSKVEPVHKHGGSHRAAPVTANKVWTKKPKAASSEVESVKFRIVKETVNQADSQSNCQVMIGSISVTVRNSTTTEHPKPKNNNIEKQVKVDSVHGTNRSSVKFWRQVSRQDTGTGGQVAVQSGNQESGDNIVSEKDKNDGDDANDDDDEEDEERTVPCESWNNNSSSLFSSRAAKDFLAQRWKEAISGEHVKLMLTGQAESSEDSPDIQVRNILGNAENKESSTTSGIGKSKLRPKSDKGGGGVKIKYIPIQRS